MLSFDTYPVCRGGIEIRQNAPLRSRFLICKSINFVNILPEENGIVFVLSRSVVVSIGVVVVVVGGVVVVFVFDVGILTFFLIFRFLIRGRTVPSI